MEEEQARLKESTGSEEDLALKEMTEATATEAQELALAKSLEKQEQLCELSRALAVLASASVGLLSYLKHFSFLFPAEYILAAEHFSESTS